MVSLLGSPGLNFSYEVHMIFNGDGMQSVEIVKKQKIFITAFYYIWLRGVASFFHAMPSLFSC